MTRAGTAIVTTRDGHIDGVGATGLYARDRRIVQSLELGVAGADLVRLGRARTGPATDRIIYGIYSGRPDPVATLQRDRTLEGTYREQLTFQSFGGAIELHVTIEISPGGQTVYDLHGDDPAGVASARATIASLRADGFDIAVDPSGHHTLTTSVVVTAQDPAELSWSIDLGAHAPALTRAINIESSDHRIQQALDRGAWDLDALAIIDPRSHSTFLAAGSPHFLAAFGRDALLASLLAMSSGAERAMKILEVLGAWQGHRHDQRTLEEPGRMLHELRVGDMGVFGLEAGEPYYASVDATPLFVVLLTECLKWGVAKDRIAALLPAARLAIDWCRHHVDPDGFVVSQPHDDGIENQGWKDSGDSMVTVDGTVVTADTSLIEVQGYVHEALLGLADLEEHVAHDADAAVELRSEADAFRTKTLEAFGCPAPVHLAMALAAGEGQLAVRSSNVGHLLGTGLLDHRLAANITETLMSPASFSGWGIRTLAADEKAYNPLGYHLGSVWPHDTALTLRGLSRRGFDDHATRVMEGLLDLAEALDFDLRELIGGFSRAKMPTPVPYRASARPQAWAAAVPFQIVTSKLGLQPDVHLGVVHVTPNLQPGERLVFRGLRLGPAVVDLAASRRGDDPPTVTIEGDRGGLNFVVHVG